MTDINKSARRFLRILAALDKPATLRQIADEAGMEVEPARRWITALHNVGAVKFVGYKGASYLWQRT